MEGSTMQYQLSILSSLLLWIALANWRALLTTPHSFCFLLFRFIFRAFSASLCIEMVNIGVNLDISDRIIVAFILLVECDLIMFAKQSSNGSNTVLMLESFIFTIMIECAFSYPIMLNGVCLNHSKLFAHTSY